MTPAFDEPAFVEHYTSRRNRVADLYPSEARFLPDLARSASSVLDVGCGAGGFVDIWRAFNAEVEYAGVDVSVPLVEAARQLHPGTRFEVGDCAEGLPLPDGAADVVQALGWLHWEPRWERALTELWRLTGRALFFDLRLGADAVGRQEFAPGAWTPYLVLDRERLLERLRALGAASIRAYGYPGPPAPATEGLPDEVVFATFVLERSGDAREELELPD
jgi:SAM-dependent methyltransferase